MIASMAVQTDSRLVRPGDAFVAVKGAARDGAQFVSAAIAAGAARVFSEDPAPPDLPPGVAWERVPDSRAAAAALACEDAGHPSRRLAVFAVTGTNGKTTVANLVRRVLEASGVPCGLLSTVENDVHPMSAPGPVPAANTTPGPVELQRLFREAAANGCRAVSMEVSSHALDQRRTDGTVFRCAVFTNLTQDHLDYHGTMAAYGAAKKRLFLPDGGAAVPPLSAAVNVDDLFGAHLAADLASRRSPPVVGYGFSERADVRVSALSLSRSGMEFALSVPGRAAPLHVRSRLLGRHNALNLAAAFSAALCAGVAPEAAAAALAAAPPVRGRLEPVEVPGSPASFFVDYAHTPDALANVLRTLRELVGPGGRLFAVFGAGGDRDRTKRPLMGGVCASGADRLVVTSDNPRSEDPGAILRDILAGIPPEALARTETEPDRAAALRLAVRLADRPGDVVLVAGKGHETYQIFADRTIPFDDREALLAGAPR